MKSKQISVYNKKTGYMIKVGVPVVVAERIKYLETTIKRLKEKLESLRR